MSDILLISLNEKQRQYILNELTKEYGDISNVSNGQNYIEFNCNLNGKMTRKSVFMYDSGKLVKVAHK